MRRVRQFAMATLLLTATSAIAQTPPATPSPANPPADATPPAPLAAAAWLPRKSAELQLLDKVNARHTLLTVVVGQEAHFGTLTIGVRNCVVRAPDQPSEAAAYLTVNDTNNEGVAFAGWMVAGQPALSMLQHPVYDLRVIGCKP